jgi:RNA polymerase sigma-70 factor (ECF subfamily)
VSDDAVDKLTAAMAAGDQDAVETFYRRYFDWLYAQARRATRRDESFCLDVVQDAVLRIVRTIRRVSSEPELRAWLRLVVQTTALDRLRSERRRQRRELAFAAIGPQEVMSQACESAEQLEWVKQQIMRIDPRLVQIVELRFERRWTLARIAQDFGLSIGTIDGRLRRALKQLRRQAREDLDV